MLPSFQVKGLCSAFLLSALLTRVVLNFPLILVTLPWQNTSVILKYHCNISSSDYWSLLASPNFFLGKILLA